MCAACIGVALVTGAGAGEYHTNARLTAIIESLATLHPQACKAVRIGSSRQGRPIHALTLGRGKDVDARTAMLIVGGIDGDYPVGSETALLLAQRLLGAPVDSSVGQLLDQYTFYILPRINPDAIEVFFETPKREQRAALRPVDDDRDGQKDEDGPEDINGDGIITMMRAVDPEGEYLPDPAAPRLMKKADRAKGEIPIYKLYVEGTDKDNDGEYNEDGPGGVDINQNFPHGYIEHGPGFGPHQISEPESKALIDFVLNHPRIAIAVVYGRHDNVVETPKGDKKDVTGRAPIALHKDDVATYKKITEIYRKITGIKKLPTESSNGAAYAWAYAQYGIPAFACRPWTMPGESSNKKDEDDDGKDEGTDSDDNTESAHEPPTNPPVDDPHRSPHGTTTTVEQSRESAPAPKEEDSSKNKNEKKAKPANKDNADWLKYSDEHRDGTGFVEWAPFDHPQLGAVEIGGFVPYFRTTPPAALLDSIAEKQLEFIVDLAGRFPRLSLSPPKLKRLSDQVYELETSLANDGYFASGIAIARQNRRVRPAVIRLDVPKEDLLGGPIVERVWSVPGGGVHKLRWVFRTNGSTVAVKVTSEKYGDFELIVPLSVTSEEEGK